MCVYTGWWATDIHSEMQICHFCQATFEPRDGHRGAHLAADIENQCGAAVCLPLEEHVCRAKWLGQSIGDSTLAPQSLPQSRENRLPPKQCRKRKHVCPPARERGHSSRRTSPKRRPSPTSLSGDQSHEVEPVAQRLHT